jgi:uncharacterized membrane protein YhaH (DUF805 family)
MISSPFSLQGRVRRLHFLIAFIVLNALGTFLDRIVEYPSSTPLLYVFYAFISWPFITLMVQRAHDAGRDGKFVAKALALTIGSAIVLALGASLIDNEHQWNMLSIFALLLVGAVFLVGFAMTMIVYFAPGDPEANEYGPNPRLKAPAPIYAGSPNAPEDALIDLAGRRGFNTGE